MVSLQVQKSNARPLQRGVRRQSFIAETILLKDVMKLLEWNALASTWIPTNMIRWYRSHGWAFGRLKYMLEALSRVPQQVSLKINIDKTEVMLNSHVVPTLSCKTWKLYFKFIYHGQNPSKRSIDGSNSAGVREAKQHIFGHTTVDQCVKMNILLPASCQMTYRTENSWLWKCEQKNMMKVC